jgi:hypothetical protein
MNPLPAQSMDRRRAQSWELRFSDSTNLEPTSSSALRPPSTTHQFSKLSTSVALRRTAHNSRRLCGESGRDADRRDGKAATGESTKPGARGCLRCVDLAPGRFRKQFPGWTSSSTMSTSFWASAVMAFRLLHLAAVKPALSRLSGTSAEICTKQLTGARVFTARPPVADVGLPSPAATC